MSKRGEKARRVSMPKIAYPAGCKELTDDLSNDELVKRLKALSRVFQDLGQEDTFSEYKQLALYLASEFFLEHSSKDVRLLVACCLADLFRVFAPDAPIKDAEQIKVIFLFMAQQFKLLENTESPSFNRAFYLVENLAFVKTLNLCQELDDSQEIITALIKAIFNVISEKHSEKLLGFFLDIISPLISELETVSSELLDIILVFIIEPLKTQNRAACNLVHDLLKTTMTSIEPSIQAFFDNMLMTGKAPDEGGGLSHRIYDLILELYTISPSLVTNVLPHLEVKLKSSEESDRIAATRTVAKILTSPRFAMSDDVKLLWSCFLGRFNDIEPSVRRLCVQVAQEFIISQRLVTIKDEISGLTMIEALRQRQHDSDENVRLEVVMTIVGAAKKEMQSVSEDLLECVKERTLDKKFKIRKEALGGLGQIYRRCCDGHGDINTVQWIRNKILHAYYQNNIDDKLLVERILNISLVPYSLEPAERMKRLYMLYGNIDDHAVKALKEIFKTQLLLRTTVKSLIDAIAMQKSGSDEKTVNAALAAVAAKCLQISRYLVATNKPLENIRKFTDEILRQDLRIRTCMIKLVAPDCSCKRAEEYVKDILKKLGNSTPQNLHFTTVKQLLERIAPVMIDCAAISALTKYVDEAVQAKTNGDECEIMTLVPNAVETGVNLLLMLSHVFPGSFHSDDVYQQLMVFVQYDDDCVSDATMQIFSNIGQQFETKHTAILKSLQPVLVKMVNNGTMKQAKHAIRCINSLYPKTKEQIFRQLYEHIETNLNFESEHLLTSIVALGHITQLCPEIFGIKTTEIVMKFLVKEILVQDRTESRPTTQQWYADHLVSEETHAKIQSMKTIVRYLLGVKNGNLALRVGAMRLLYTSVLCEGDLMERGHLNSAEMSRIRVHAGCCFLRLAQEHVYAEKVRLDHFETVALLVNDPCLEVREIFVQKLHKGLISLRLPLQYLSMLCLGALDPVKERRALLKQMLTANIARRRAYLKQNPATTTAMMLTVMPDYVMPYVIHLLAHDPDFSSSSDVKPLKNIRDALWFVLEPLVSKNDDYSYGFYKRMFEMIKQTKDAQAPDCDESNNKLYVVCDLAIDLLTSKVTNYTLKDFPAEPVLPTKLFTAPDLSFPNTIIYLPVEFRSAPLSMINISSTKPAVVPLSKKQAMNNSKVKAKLPATENKKTAGAATGGAKSRSMTMTDHDSSPSSSNPTSPISTTKSPPLVSTNGLNKMQSARVVNRKQEGESRAQKTGVPLKTSPKSTIVGKKRNDSVRSTSSDMSAGDGDIEEDSQRNEKNALSLLRSPPSVAAKKGKQNAANKKTSSSSNMKKVSGSTSASKAPPSQKKITSPVLSLKGVDAISKETTAIKSKPTTSGSAKRNAAEEPIKGVSQPPTKKAKVASGSTAVTPSNKSTAKITDFMKPKGRKQEMDLDSNTNSPLVSSGEGGDDNGNDVIKFESSASGASPRRQTKQKLTATRTKTSAAAVTKTSGAKQHKKSTSEEEEEEEAMVLSVESSPAKTRSRLTESNKRLRDSSQGDTPSYSASPSLKTPSASPKSLSAASKSNASSPLKTSSSSSPSKLSTSSDTKRNLAKKVAAKLSTASKKRGRAINGTSDSQGSFSSKKSKTSSLSPASSSRRTGVLASRRRAGAAAKAAQKYADFEVSPASPKKKR